MIIFYQLLYFEFLYYISKNVEYNNLWWENAGLLGINKQIEYENFLSKYKK